MVNRYIVAPDFSTAPPPSGPICLGSVLRDVSEYTALNSGQVVIIAHPLPPDHKGGFAKSRGHLLDGHADVFAQIFTLSGARVETGGTYAREKEDVLAVTNLETISFNTTSDYIRQTTETDGVRIFLDAKGFKKPVYLVTGIKIARGTSMTISLSVSVGAKLRLGLAVPLPLGVPVGDVGPDVGIDASRTASESFATSSDFVLAIRVRQIPYKKSEPVDRENNKGATMMDGVGKQQKVLGELEDLGEEFDFDLKELRQTHLVTKMLIQNHDGKNDDEYILY